MCSSALCLSNAHTFPTWNRFPGRGTFSFNDASIMHQSVCEEIAVFEGDKPLAARLKRHDHAQSTPYSTLKLLIKSHKPAGNVSFRALHSCPQSAFAGVSVWLDEKLSGYMRVRAPWLLNSCEACADQAKKMAPSGWELRFLQA